MKSYLGQTGLPRGIRNNNPGNLIITSSAWVGKVPVSQNTDGHFEQFTSIEYGIRAMAYDIIGDIGKGKNTLTKLISEYAPSSENNTAAYIANVASATGLNADAIIPLSYDTLVSIIRAKIVVENGPAASNYVSTDTIKEGIDLLPASKLQQLKKKVG